MKPGPGAAARHDLAWRSRGNRTPEALANIVLAAKQDEDVRRYIRAFDFQSGPHKDEALRSVAFGPDVNHEIALAAIQRLPESKLGADDRSRQRLVALLTSGPPGPASIRLIKQLELTEAYPRLLEVALQDGNDGRGDALAALLDLKQQDLVRAALESEDPARALATGRVLAQSRHPAARELLWAFLANEKLDIQARKESARELGRSNSGADQLLKRIARGELKDEMRQAIAGVLLTHRHAALRKRAEKLFPLAPARDAQPLPKLGDLIARKGDAKAGRGVFFKQGQCVTCHRVANQGQAIGPDLDSIGTKLARPALFEAILYPSAAISHDYEMYSAELKDGPLVSGTLVNRSDREIQLRDAQGNLQTLDRAQVKTLARLPVSLMPDNLHQLMTTRELVDLVEYMTTLILNPGAEKGNK